MFTTNRFQIYHPDKGFLSIEVEWVPGTSRVSKTALVWLHDPVTASRFRRDHIDEFLIDPKGDIDLTGVRVVSCPVCACCGYDHMSTVSIAAVVHHIRPELRRYRCWRHLERNPCAVEGCEKTRAAKGHFSNDAYLCRDHWRQVCPPRSQPRAVVNRLFRLARKRGYGRAEDWSRDLETRYWRVWGALVARARSQTSGDLDMTEINKLMGWDE